MRQVIRCSQHCREHEDGDKCRIMDGHDAWELGHKQGLPFHDHCQCVIERLEPFEDRKHLGNGALYLTSETCVEPGCTQQAGTLWSPLWCFTHNVIRMRRISAGLEKLKAELGDMT